MSYQIEICANSVQSAINAQKGGADRVELCDNLWEGGTTPSVATIQVAKKSLDIPVFVLVRPRGGDFVYSDLEFDIIKQDIIEAKVAGADGIVSGALTKEGKIDCKRTRQLVELSQPLPFTFHRAFDHAKNSIKSIEDLIDCGVTRVLTSGQRERAIDGKENLIRMISKASERLVILPGGGINKDNVGELYEAGCREFHLSAKTLVEGQGQRQENVPMNGLKEIPENAIYVSDSDKIIEIKRILDAKM